MGIFSKEKLNNLYWLGRYVERTQTTIALFLASFDRMIDGDGDDYRAFLGSIGVPDTYVDKDDFAAKYPFDEGSPFSISSNFNRAFDNAVVMRECLGSDALSYLQMVLYDIQSAGKSDGRATFLMQAAIDHILAFWGCLDDRVDDEATRCVVKLGKDLERLDLHLRLKESASVLARDFSRMRNHLTRSAVQYDTAVLNTLRPLIQRDRADFENALKLVGRLVNP